MIELTATAARLLELSAHPDAALLIPIVLPWLYEAGAAYFDWIFGGGEPARRTLAAWMARPSSEISISRVTLMLEAGRPIGAFVALGGDELARCRKADAMAMLSAARGEERERLLARMRAVRGLFPAVRPDEFYLSKVGVAAERRAGGLGRALVAAYVAAGRAAGFSRFRLDVSADNRAAVGLYRSMGFQIDRQSVGAGGRLTYLAMARQDQAACVHGKDHRPERVSV